MKTYRQFVKENKAILELEEDQEYLPGPICEVDRDGDDDEGGSKKGKKNLKSAAKLMGHYGGEKGGPARDKKLSPRRKSEIARQGARARWRGGSKDE